MSDDRTPDDPDPDPDPETEQEAERERRPEEEPEAEPDRPVLDPEDVREYWRRNVRLIAGLFVVWFAVSFLAAILIAEPLTEIPIGNIPLSFWFAQQGSIAVFVLLIYVYARQMNKLDREFGVED